MKILWLINIVLPQLAVEIGQPVNNAGGWMVYLANEVPKHCELCICYPDNEARETEVAGVTYHGIITSDNSKNIKKVSQYMAEILKKENPDIIHIWGTEHLHCYAMVEAAASAGLHEKVIISIQGLVSVYAKHFMAGIPYSTQIIPSIRDLIRNDSLIQSRKRMIFRGIYEQMALKEVEHVIGRTTWDRFCVSSINNNVHYHFNNENLRDSFYFGKWSLEECEKYSVFVSQGQSPLKGLHQILLAISYLKPKYPNIHLYIAGSNDPFGNGIKSSRYQIFLKRLKYRLGINNCVEYCGNLSEQEMHTRFLKSHVFVSPSSIENSPNSVGEAMILGVPTVSSYVGGVADLLVDKIDGYLYQFDAPYMLSGYIDEIFADELLAQRISDSARRHALTTHNRDVNLEKLLEIYELINKG